MGDSKEMKNVKPWKSIPKFGDWDNKGVYPDYSVDFSKVREMKKHQKNDLSIPDSCDTENETVSASSANSNGDCNQTPTAKTRSILRYFRCCAKNGL